MTIVSNIQEKISHLPVSLPDANYFVRVPDGEYVAAFVGSEAFRFLGKRPKIALWFQIIGGPCDGLLIASYYNLLKIEADAGSAKRVRDPSFEVGWRASLVRDVSTLFPDLYSPEELPTSVPEIRRTVRLATRTVKNDMRGNARTEAFLSSVVKNIVGWAYR